VVIILEKKDDLIAALRTADSDIKMDTTSTEPTVFASEAQNARNLTPDELRELATIADEMRHLRKQWIAQSMKPIPTAQSSTYRTAQKPSLNS
jgi:hypothetical protein